VENEDEHDDADAAQESEGKGTTRHMLFSEIDLFTKAYMLPQGVLCVKGGILSRENSRVSNIMG